MTKQKVSIIGVQGIEQIVILSLTEDEQTQSNTSAKAVTDVKVALQ